MALARRYRCISDKANHLRSGTVVQAQGSGQKEEYTYDAADNVLSLSRDGGTPQPYSIEPSTNRFLGNGDVVHDASCQMLEIGPYINGQPQFEMGYDPFGMQTRFASRNGQAMGDYLYLYGPGDRRLVSFNTQTGERSVDLRGFGDEVLRQYHVNGWGSAGSGGQGEGWAHQKDFLYGPEGVFATRNRSGSEQVFLHKDHFGIPRALTNNLGDLIGRHDYYPFGAEAPRAGQADEKMKKFTGHERDPLGFTDYMLGRTYLYPFMRFATPDPARDGWSLYAYVGNNPVNRVDPDGTIGVALNEAAKAQILAIVGSDASAVSFSEDGIFTVEASQSQLRDNAGLRLLHGIAAIEETIGFVVGTEVHSSGGPLVLGPNSAVFNMSTTTDHRPGTQVFPPAGFDGMVGVYSGFAANRSENVGTNTRPVAGPRPIGLGPISFHELAENYYKTSQGQQHSSAHQQAIDAEWELRAERPELNGLAFGAGPYVVRQMQ